MKVKLNKPYDVLVDTNVIKSKITITINLKDLSLGIASNPKRFVDMVLTGVVGTRKQVRKYKRLELENK